MLNAFWSRDNSLKCRRRLEGEPAILGVADLVQVGVAGELDHGGGAAHEHQGVVSGRGEVLADHVLADEAFTVLPV